MIRMHHDLEYTALDHPKLKPKGHRMQMQLSGTTLVVEAHRYHNDIFECTILEGNGKIEAFVDYISTNKFCICEEDLNRLFTKID